MTRFVAEMGSDRFPRILDVPGGPGTAARKFWRLHVRGHGPTWPKGVKVTSVAAPIRMHYFKYTTIANDGTPVKVTRNAWIKLMGLVARQHRY